MKSKVKSQKSKIKDTKKGGKIIMVTGDGQQEPGVSH